MNICNDSTKKILLIHEKIALITHYYITDLNNILQVLSQFTVSLKE